jgi:AcrR family transcriptional regulator
LAAKQPISSSAPTSADPTPDRILDAAESMFASSGFAATSVRDITQQAGCNVSAVSYHFGSNEGLYERVFVRRLDALRNVRLEAVHHVLEEAASHEDLSLLLSTFAEAFLQPLMEPRRGPDTVRLMMRELTAPRLPKGTIFEHLIGPIQQAMVDALQRCVGELTAQQALLCLHSFIGQLVHVLQLAQIQQLSGGNAASGLNVQEVLSHVVHFSEAGIRAQLPIRSEASDA